jgi:hypothetical protein
MLYIRAQLRAFEKDVPAHRREYAELARRVTSVCLRRWRVPAGENAGGRRPRRPFARRPLAAEAPERSATR